MEQVQNRNGEREDSKRKDQEEDTNLADDANDDSNKMAYTFVDSELKQLTGGMEG